MCLRPAKHRVTNDERYILLSMNVLFAQHPTTGSVQMSSIRIVIVEDHEVARRGIRHVLATNPDIEVIGEVANGEEATKKVQDLHPDIVLLDISLPGMSGIDVAEVLRHNAPDSRIIFVSQHDSVPLAKDALRAGASGYVVKSDAGRDLLPAIEGVRKGNTFVSRSLVSKGFS